MTSLPSKSEIFKVFNTISSSYDRVNRLLSLGLDLKWRQSLESFIPKKDKISFLDLATGTGDQIVSLLDKHHLSFEKVVGIDLAEDMLAIAKKKLKELPYGNKVEFIAADAMHLPFDTKTFDMITMSFGIRNVVSIEKTLNEMYRVLKPDGVALILEFSLPKGKLIKPLFLFYLENILPLIGRFFSKHPTAYSYLNKTIQTFPCGESFGHYLKVAGFEEVTFKAKTFGSVSLYVGRKPSNIPH